MLKCIALQHFIVTFALAGILILYLMFEPYSEVTGSYLDSTSRYREVHLPQYADSDALKKYAPEIFQRVPTTFHSDYRSPCWSEQDSLSCLPYFYLIGSYKCGTSDLWDKLVQHPGILPVAKEPHWWAWRRFGYTGAPINGVIVRKIRNITGSKDDSSFDWYLNWFNYQTNASLARNKQLVFGDASITQLWGTADGRASYTDPEPRFVLADLIHSIQPGAKIFAILRNPVDRALSEFFYSHKKSKISREDFHSFVEDSLGESQRCLDARKSARACAFSLEIGNWQKFVPIHGAYYLYLREWVEAYGPDKIHVIRTEDWINSPEEVLPQLYQYLELAPVSPEWLSKILARKVKNTRKNRKPQFTAMMNSTRQLLEDFYHPWNRKLADLLGDSKFLWGAT